MIVLHLTTKNGLIGIQFFSGTVDRAVVHPREIIKYALLAGGAASIILVHNHPSGQPDPSKEDRVLTEAIIKCAELFDIRVLDHLILGENGFFSAKREGWF
jgi:DNA repair protein RadC